MSTKGKRGALYLRVSTGEQHAENQRPEVEQLATARGVDVVLREEEAASTRYKRPAFDRIMTAARRRKIDVVVIWALDRLGRSMVGNLEAVLELDRLGVEVVSVREPWLDTQGPTRSLLVAIFSWVAEQERDQRSARTKAGLARVKAKGVKLGPPRRNVNVAVACSLKNSGKTWAQVARVLQVGRSTLLRAVQADRAARCVLLVTEKGDESPRPANVLAPAGPNLPIA